MGWTVGFKACQGQEIFLFSKTSSRVCSPSILLICGYQGSSLGVKLSECKFTSYLSLLLLSRMSGGLTLLPLYALMMWTGATLPLPTVVQSSVAWKSVRILYLINSVIMFKFQIYYGPHYTYKCSL